MPVSVHEQGPLVETWPVIGLRVLSRSYGEFHSEEDARQFTDKVEGVFATGNSFQAEHKSERDNRDFLQHQSG